MGEDLEKTKDKSKKTKVKSDPNNETELIPPKRERGQKVGDKRPKDKRQK